MKRTILAALLAVIPACLFAQDGDVNFSAAFKKENDRKSRIEINEVKELIHIMIAITPTGLGNDDMIQLKGPYYQDVLKQFAPYGKEPVIATFDSLLQKSPLHYVFLTGNAIAYDFEKDQLLPNNVFLLPADEVAGTKITVNPITTYKTSIEDFAKKSGFREFYAAHAAYYQGIVSDYEKNANLDKQWKWLEANFNTHINSYQILCSPLINGLNYTLSFKKNDFEMIQMVLPPIDHNDAWSAKYTEAFNTRGMFTEIDHNYVRKPGDQSEKKINEALKNRSKWVDTTMEGTAYYPTPVKVFNEYMTFGVFILYCEEVYKNDPAILKEVYTDVNEVMSKQRGFVKMKEFTDCLIRLRKAQPRKKIDELYPALLNWCMKQ
ncbi:DUF4932 domain-containing protein [Chitinophaga sp. CC14]|uniref:DUF4932 domain-containing protein n=1 Tax=Chitinophaga sp. CC14 TaxID=3029199 RepID=UPI003B7D2EBF